MGPSRKLARSACLGAIAAIGAAPAVAERFEVIGGCRDGVPNGAYELRATDGRLRVAGAFAQGKKTGTFIFWTSSGGRIAVVPYDDDLKSGTVARWYVQASGVELGRRLEAPFSADVLHGVERSWHSNGVERSEAHYEHGTLVSVRAWDRRGAPLREAEARKLVAQNAEADKRFLAELDATVRDHRPICE